LAIEVLNQEGSSVAKRRAEEQQRININISGPRGSGKTTAVEAIVGPLQEAGYIVVNGDRLIDHDDTPNDAAIEKQVRLCRANPFIAVIRTTNAG
jgi:Ni2+-binding GTPase involved in maturation of urease and hydrogenase